MKQSSNKIRIPERQAALIRGMHPQLKRKVKASLRTILTNPEEGKALKGELSGLRSFRVGRFRIIYRVKEGLVEIVAVGPREKIYEETFLILRRGSP